MDTRRLLKHLFATDFALRRAFPRDLLMRIEQAVKSSETGHRGELRFVVEGALPPLAIWRGLTARARAIELFSQLHVWDTEENSGVLIYVQFVDHKVEIVADRGIASKVEHATWREVCAAMERAFKAGRYEEGVLGALAETDRLLERHFPAGPANPNELPDHPLVI
jgi:uncharacterized membrane protein